MAKQGFRCGYQVKIHSYVTVKTVCHKSAEAANCSSWCEFAMAMSAATAGNYNFDVLKRSCEYEIIFLLADTAANCCRLPGSMCGEEERGLGK